MKIIKKEDLHIRITKEDKKKIQRNASKHKMTTTDYVTELCLHGSLKEDDVINGAEAYVAYREFVEFCTKQFGCADEINRRSDEIWDTIVSK